MEKRSYRCGLKSELFDEAYRLRHEEGKSYTAIGKILGIYSSTVYYWLANFAGDNNNCKQKAMKQTEEETPNNPKGEFNDCSPEEQIAKLTEALHAAEMRAQRAEMRADLSDEMISIAEAKYNIQIKKKAGAKR